MHSLASWNKRLLLNQVSNIWDSYNRVCGRTRGYQYGFTRAFHSYQYACQRTLDASYVSGLSVTHPDPDKPGKREHVWTLQRGFQELTATPPSTAPMPCTLVYLHLLTLWAQITSMTRRILTTVTSNGTWRTTTVCGPQQGQSGNRLVTQTSLLRLYGCLGD